MDENFIPWEQIEPLVKDGMTGGELHEVLCGRLGLPPDKYFFATRRLTAGPLAQEIRHGLYVEHVDRPSVESLWARSANHEAAR